MGVPLACLSALIHGAYVAAVHWESAGRCDPGDSQ